MKTCTCCKQTKVFSQFQVNLACRDGHASWCKQCSWDADAARKAAKRQAAKQTEIQMDAPPGYKRCVQCNELKHLTLFSMNRRMRDGKSSYCKACQAANIRERRAAEPLQCPVPIIEDANDGEITITHTTPPHLPPIVLRGVTDGRLVRAHGVTFEVSA